MILMTNSAPRTRQPNTYMTTAMADAIVARYVAGGSIRECATAAGVAYGTVRRLLMLRHVPIRARGAQPRSL